MENNELLPAEICCYHYNIEYNFLELLEQHGLINIIYIEQKSYLHTDALQTLEPLIRMHYDLEINVEGIEAINSMLMNIRNLQSEVINLKNRLKIYENN